MAKRENFIVKMNGVEVAVKHAWNSAVRETEWQIGEVANNAGCEYRLTSHSSVKEGFYFTSGVRVWEGQDGQTVRFTIEKECNK